MNTCTMCGSAIPEGQKVCSMCYGDPAYGNDGYYQAELERFAESQTAAQESEAMEELKQQEDE